MKKILFVANIQRHFMAFHLPYMKWLKNQGYEVHCAANGGEVKIPIVDKQFNICIQRSPFHWNNIKAYRQLKDIIRSEGYDLVHCHTAMGSVVARLASRSFRKCGSLKVLYTAHGFHFFKGAPIQYWLFYYPVEKYLSRFTDVIITINHEDYNLIKTHSFKNKETFIIPGIGINTDRLFRQSVGLKNELRQQYGYKVDDIILIYVAEYIERKNHKFILDAVPDLVRKIPNIKILFAGKGKLFEQAQEYAKKLQVQDYVNFLGFRKDIAQLIVLSDIGISSSRQEGLPMNVAEELYTGLPVVVSEERGHKELVEHGVNGFIYPQMDQDSFVQMVVTLAKDPVLRAKMSENAKKMIQRFTIENTLNAMANIYRLYL